VPAGLGRPVAAVTHNTDTLTLGKGVSAIKKKAEQPGVKRMNLNVEVDLHNRFKAATAAQGLNMTDVLLEFIEQYVSKHGQSAKQPKGRRG